MKRLAIYLLCTGLMAGCASTPTDTTRREPAQPSVASSEPGSVFELIRAAELAEPGRANTLRLQAAELALEENNPTQASNIAATIKQPVASELVRRHGLLRAKLALNSGDGFAALDWLRSPLMNQNLNRAEQIELGQLRAQAYLLARSYLASARERIFLDPLLKGEASVTNREAIFSALMSLPQSNLNEQANKAITSELRGWLSLAAITKYHQNNPMRQLEAFNQWQRVWSSHPAAITPPQRLQSLSSVVANQASSIALLLPLNGELAPYGRAIRDAIIATRLQMGSEVTIQVFDTSNADISELIQTAAQRGAELSIGPLDRGKVTQLANLANLPMPTLALNRTLNGEANPNLYQFGLAPEDEMIQVADQVYREGKQNALIIYPDNAWGERNVEAFRSRWRDLGGNVINASAFSDQKDYSTLIKTLLDVDLSESRATNLRRIIGQGFEFTPRRRQDIDFVFLLANQDQARGINPTLAFYYAEDIPVYSTSHVYGYSDSRIESIDLNGIRFCDIPWKLGEPDSAQAQLQTLWPGAKSSLAPFYALGVDAFQLYPRLEQLKKLPGERIYGETGILRLDANNVINRTLAWAKFTDGNVIPAPQVINAQ